MIDIFWGGFLFHPAGIDYADETCSHGCAYCFANIGKSTREGNVSAAIKALYRNSENTYTNWMLKNGYPIVTSNQTDCFATNNLRNTRAFYTHLAELGTPVFVQTKGGEGVGEIIESLPKKPVIYISITMLNDETAKRVERNAPLPSARLEIARYFIERGYVVIAAINPCSKTWLPKEDFIALCEKFKQIGVRHVVIEMLDMSPTRMRKINDARKDRMETATATIGKDDRQYVRECTEYLVQQGFLVAKKGMPFASDFYTDVETALNKVMPSLQRFVNECFARDSKTVTFGAFADYISRYIPLDMEMKSNALRGYLIRSGFDTWKDNKRVDTFRDLLAIVWNDHRSRLSIQRHTLFSPLMDDEKFVRDSQNHKILLFNQPKKGGQP
jgi:DNA repair photolyase